MTRAPCASLQVAAAMLLSDHPRLRPRAPLGRLRVRAALHVRMSGIAIVQYNSTGHTLDARQVRDPLGERSPLSLSRSVIVKYFHTLRVPAA